MVVTDAAAGDEERIVKDDFGRGRRRWPHLLGVFRWIKRGWAGWGGGGFRLEDGARETKISFKTLDHVDSTDNLTRSAGSRSHTKFHGKVKRELFPKGNAGVACTALLLVF